jgi:hypothetical protein
MLLSLLQRGVILELSFLSFENTNLTTALSSIRLHYLIYAAQTHFCQNPSQPRIKYVPIRHENPSHLRSYPVHNSQMEAIQ